MGKGGELLAPFKESSSQQFHSSCAGAGWGGGIAGPPTLSILLFLQAPSFSAPVPKACVWVPIGQAPFHREAFAHAVFFLPDTPFLSLPQ